MTAAAGGLDAGYARAMARHVKAALLHLGAAGCLAERAGVDVDAAAHDVPAAGLIRDAYDAVQDLDMWAVGSARASGAAAAGTYEHTETWCHAQGGSLPAGSWPGLEPAPSLAAPGPARAEMRARLARLRAARQAWDATARACTCTGEGCTRRGFRDHAGKTTGCMACAELDPDQPCYAAVLRALQTRDGE